MSSAVWTPVQRPPSLGNHDILSSDGCIVMRALREQYEQALGMINRRNRGFDTRIRQHASGNMEYCNSERGISPALQTNNAHNVGNITGIYFHNGDVVDYAAQDKRHHSIEIKLEDVESLASAQQAGHIMEVDSVNQEMPFVEQVNKANIVSGKGFTETCSDVEAITLSATQSIATFEPCRKQAVCSESKKASQDRSARFEGLRESARQLDRDHPKSCTVTGPPVRSSCSFGIRPLKQCKIEDFGFQSENVAKSKIVGFRSEIVAKNKDCRHEDKNKFCNDGINLLEDHTNVRTSILRSELSIQSCNSRQSGDGELQEVEKLINQSNLTSRAITGSQKVLFKVPFKKQTKVRVIKPETVSSLLSSSSSSSSATPTTSQLLHGDQIDESTRSKVTDWVQSSEELCLTLVYRNKSTQLREVRVPPGKRKNKLDDENGRREIGYVMAILLQEDHDPCDKDDLRSSKCRVIKLVFDSVDKEYTAWARELTKCVMSQRTRKICYDGQELAYQFIKHYKFDNQEVCTQWCFLDVKIASWVLDPDNPPQQFEDVTESLKLQPQKYTAGKRHSL
ncbi:uncharacterized protein [Ptychodera flava]|uniref:uncharacterized protein isoform X1 n=1 Tax=Ptychodera flava TaxID=63121 RepID=UPI00396A32C7